MKLIIDTDAGIDDAVAIFMALVYPGVELLAISTVMGNVPLAQATRNAGIILNVAAAPNIPLFEGCEKPLRQTLPLDATDVHGADGLGGAGAGVAGRFVQPEHAALALIRLVRENPGQLTLLTLGPLTNIALAIRLAPDFLANVARLVIMGGSVDGRGNTTPAAEFNILVDPEAAAVVFDACHRAGLQAEVVSWETTLDYALPMPVWESIIAGESTLARFCQKMTTHLKNVWGADIVLWPDPLAAAVALEPDIITEAEVRSVTVEYGQTAARGHTMVDYRWTAADGVNACLVRKLNMQRFQELLRLAVK